MRINKLCYAPKQKLVLHTCPQSFSYLPTITNLPTLSNLTSTNMNSSSKSHKDLTNQTLPRQKRIESNYDKAITPLKTRPVSNKRTSSKLQLENQKNNKTVTQLDLINSHIQQVIELLKQRYIVSQSHLTSFTIRRGHLSELIHHLIEKKVKEKSKEQKKTGMFAFLDGKVELIESCIEQVRRQSKGNTICIDSAVTSITCTSEDYHREVAQINQQLTVLFQKKKTMEADLTHLHQRKQQMIEEYLHEQEEKQRQAIEQQQQLADLRSRVILAEQEEIERQEREERWLSQTIDQSNRNSLNNHSIDQERRTRQIEIEECCSSLLTKETLFIDKQVTSMMIIINEIKQMFESFESYIAQAHSSTKNEEEFEYMSSWRDKIHQLAIKQQNIKSFIQIHTRKIHQFAQMMKKWAQFARNQLKMKRPMHEQLFQAISHSLTFVSALPICSNCADSFPELPIMMTKIKEIANMIVRF